MSSKREKLDDIIRRSVDKTIHAIVFDYPETAEILRKYWANLRVGVAYEMTAGNPYSMREIQDVMDWKKSRGNV